MHSFSFMAILAAVAFPVARGRAQEAYYDGPGYYYPPHPISADQPRDRSRGAATPRDRR